MKVVHLSTTDYGGAYKAAERIHKSMLLCGVDSKVLVRTKTREDSDCEAFFHNPVSKLISKVKNVGNLLLSDGEVISDYLGTNVSKHPDVQTADVIILHWVNSFVSYHNVEQLLKTNKKIIWVMHDMWLFTGGCHCDQNCNGYQEECGICRVDNIEKKVNSAVHNFKRKQRMLYGANITLVGPSKWIIECAKESNITKNKSMVCIHNPIDQNVFYFQNRTNELREKLGLPNNKKIVLFGAMNSNKDHNKGMRYLIQALRKIKSDQFVTVIFGNTTDCKSLEIPMDVYAMGMIQDENSLAELYNCADVFVAPSMQESFGYTVCEALSCGTPVVAFPAGGLLEQIRHEENGYLAQMCDVDDLVKGIEWAVKRKHDNLNLLDNGLRSTGEKYKRLLF